MPKKSARKKNREEEDTKDTGYPGLDPKELYFIPLGGSEQFGVNLNLYCYGGKILIVDCGMGFADERHPGIDLLLPDPAYLESRRDDIVGMIITHAHEDHIGAVPYLWPRLQCPIYTTPFSAAVLRHKFEEFPDNRGARVTIVRPGDSLDIAPFRARFINVSHSIPDTCAVILDTKAGTVVHSGDWNLDPTPIIGKPTDSDTLRKIGNDGVIAYVGDSTNAQVPGRTGSESEVEKGLEALFKECRGRIAVTCFSSNIGRIRSVAKAAQATDRSVALIGRSLHTMIAAAGNTGYLNGISPFIDEENIDDVPDENLVMVVTGSQGEARAALSRMARGEHQGVSLKPGDSVVFSARPIPGNESEINEVKNNLIAGGVHVITPQDTKHCIHVSGHPCRDEITDMLHWVRPRLVVPVHGERMQLEAQAELARACQVEHVIVPRNGSVIRLGPDKPRVEHHIETGLLAVEPGRIIRADHAAIAERRKLQFSGTVHVTIVLDRRGSLATDPQISTTGLVNEQDRAERRFVGDIAGEVEDIINDLNREDLNDDVVVEEEIRNGIRRFVNMVLKIKPKTTVHIVRL